MIDLFTFKDFENCYLKALLPLKIGNKSFEKGEVVFKFEKIQVARLQEAKNHITARGGWDNRGLVWWEAAQDLFLNFSQGVFSKEQFALLSNARIIEQGKDVEFLNYEEWLESTEDGVVPVTKTGLQNFYLYDENYERIEWTFEDQRIKIETPYKKVLARYEYLYDSKSYKILYGQRLTEYLFSLEAKTRLKDDATGEVVTGIIRIPKLKMASDLSIAIGSQGKPTIANFSAIGVPAGERKDSRIAEFIVLSSDLDSDF